MLPPQIQSILEKSKQRKHEKQHLTRIRHVMMCQYGWIPQEEWKKLPLPTVFELLEQIKEDIKMMEREQEKSKVRGRRH